MMTSHRIGIYFIGLLLACLVGVQSLFIRDSDLDMQKYGDLVFVHLIYRHGDRAPAIPTPGDKYTIDYWPEGWGQLTNIGKQQQYELGEWVRRRYKTFLSSNYNINDIYVQSSQVDRTIMSAECHLAGLYPPTGSQIWNNKMNWQPIPVNNMPQNIDYLIAPSVPSSCQAYQNAYNAYMASPGIKELDQSFQGFYNIITKNSGTFANTLSNLTMFRDAWTCESSHNLKLPDWTKELYPNNDQFYQAALKYYYLPTGTKFLAKFMSGFLLKDMLDRFTSKTQNTLSPNRKLWMYSTHDSKVFSFLNALDIPNNKFVPYTGAIMMELRLYQNVYYVQLFYKDSDVNPNPIYIPGCGISCPLSTMYQIYRDILPTYDFNTECQLG